MLVSEVENSLCGRLYWLWDLVWDIQWRLLLNKIFIETISALAFKLLSRVPNYRDQ